MTFVFRPGLLAAVVCGVAILCALGTWQLQRKAWKDALIAQVEAREGAAPVGFDAALARAARGEPIEYQAVVLEGVYDHGEERHVFAVREGRAGIYVFTPLARDGAAPVWINRGFVPQQMGAEPGKSPGEAAVGRPTGRVRIEGVLRAPQRPTAIETMVRPKDQPTDNLYFFRDPARFADAPPAGAFYVESAGGENAARWPEASISRADFPNRHLEYALTWFGLAAALIGVYLAFSLRRGAGGAGAQPPV